MQPFMAMIIPIGQFGGSVDPGFGNNPGQPPGMWPGNHPSQPWVPPSSQPPGMWPGHQPSQPIVRPGDPSWGGGHPGGGGGGVPPGIWPGPGPRPPIVLPGDPSWEGKPPEEPVRPETFTWHTAWTQDEGWVVVGVPNDPHPTPSRSGQHQPQGTKKPAG